MGTHRQGRVRRVVAAFTLVAACALPAASARAQAGTPPSTPIGHVWTIMLENKDFAHTFGANPGSPALAVDIRSRGALVSNYYGVAHPSLPNYIAMISGQPPNKHTQGDCTTYTTFADEPVFTDGDIFKGDTCQYPRAVKTLADQLDGAGLTWKAYAQDMGDDPAREASTCAYPNEGALDKTQGATAKDQYAARHNPFVYFRSLVGSGGDAGGSCQTNDVNLRALPTDLKSIDTTPAYSYIIPDLCADGHDETCPDTRQHGGYAGIEEFLKAVVPLIEASPAFKKDGLLIITFDEAEGDDSTACCNEPTGPNVAAPGRNGPGGGKVGAVVLGPSVKPGIYVNAPMNHYGYLRSMEDFFGLSHIGYARLSNLPTFQSIGLFGAGDPPPPPPQPAEPTQPLTEFAVARKVRRNKVKVTLELIPEATAVVTIKNRGRVFKTTTITESGIYRIGVGRRFGKFKVNITATAEDGTAVTNSGVARK